MKKFLSMVLALALSASLFTVGASAKDFTDDSKITYNEAVDVISEIGVVDGYTDGSFGPTTELTRGAAAKIICNLLLGPTTASALGADTAPYKDVPTSNVFAGYIAYCKQQNIISGYADGSFRPAAPLTGYAFMKMLLGALGYDSSIEGYTGANWSVAVAKQALNIGLDDGNDNFVGTKAVTREEAALYAFNMLQADMVEYDSKTTVNVGGATVVVGSNKAESRKWQSSATANNNIVKNDNIVQFAEEYFNKLVKSDDTTDAFGRPATRWDYKGVKIGTYADKADKTYVGSVKLNDIYNDLGMSTKDSDAKVYQNGVEVATVEVSKSNDDKLKELSFKAAEKTGDYAEGAKVDNKIGDGTIVEVFRDDDTNDVTICAISVYAGEISQVKAATSKKDAYVVVDTNDKTKDLLTGSRDEFETTEFAEDDVVAFTFTEKDNEIKTMYKMDSVEGELTKRVAAKSVTLGDTTYKYAKEYAFGDDLKEASLTNKSSYVVYTDANGYVLYVKDAEFAATAYALVEKISGDKGKASSIIGSVDQNQSIWDGNRAKLLFADGSEKTVNLSKDYANETGDKKVEAGDIVRYSVESDGDYKLTALKAGAQVDSTSTTSFYIKDKTLSGLKDSSISADSKTIFVVENGDDFDVYTGIKNAPTVTGTTANSGAAAYAYQSDKAIKVIFVLGAKSVNSSKDVTFIAAASASKLTTASDTTDYYVYNAVVKGEITTVMVNSKVTLTESVNGTSTGGRFVTLVAGYGEYDGNIVLNTTTSDSDDIIDTGDFDSSDVKVYQVTGVKNASKEEVKVGSAVLSCDSAIKAYLIDTDGNIEAVAIEDVKNDSKAIVTYTMEDGEITNLFIQETEDR